MKGVGLRYMSCPVTWLRFGHVMWHHISSSMGPGWRPWECRTGSLEKRKPSGFLLGSHGVPVGFPLGSSRVPIGFQCRKNRPVLVRRPFNGRSTVVGQWTRAAGQDKRCRPAALFAPAALNGGCLGV